MTSKYTYDDRNRHYIMHDVEAVKDNCSRTKYAEVLLPGFPSFEGALYRDKNDRLFVQSTDHSFHPKECLFSIGHYERLGAAINIFAREH